MAPQIFITKKRKAEIRERRRKQLKKLKEGKEKSAPSAVAKNEGTKNGTIIAGNKKRPREEEDHNKGDKDNWASPATTTASESDENDGEKKEKVAVVRIPDGLSGKQLRKFRKDARRKVIAEGGNKDAIRFVSSTDEDNNSDGDENNQKGENGENDGGTSKPPRKKKPKKNHPRINDLLAAAEAEKKIQKEKEKRRAAEEALPSEIKDKYVALDCEMVGIGSSGKTSALARASLVDWYGNVLLDTFVTVPDRVTDFRTHVSGIKPKHIDITNEKAMDPKDVRFEIGRILKNKILVGHALKNDFSAIMMNHPKQDVRDTAQYKPFMRPARGGRKPGGKMRPRKLRDLTKQYLDRDIQVEGEAHCSIDDAKAAMDLFKFARESWEKDIQKKTKKRKN